MFAAHFAAALAIKVVAPRAPTSALLVGAMLPDVVWVACAVSGMEYTATAPTFDGWSHSVVSILVEATLFAGCFVPAGFGVLLAVWCGVASHVVLDGLIHPRPLELFPHSTWVVGWDLWTWGKERWLLGRAHYWWIQLAVTLSLLAVYWRGQVRLQLSWNLAAASCLLILGLHWAF